jgi:hypothetical protein
MQYPRRNSTVLNMIVYNDERGNGARTCPSICPSTQAQCVDLMDYKDIAHQHNNTRWTRLTGSASFAKVGSAGSNPVVRSKNLLFRKTEREQNRRTGPGERPRDIVAVRLGVRR